jgi:uncharacterized iron-regulated protein
MNARGVKGAIVVFKILILAIGAAMLSYSCSAVNQAEREDSVVSAQPHKGFSRETGIGSMPVVLDPKSVASLESIIPRLADKRVVYVGETHDRFEHHLNQLEIIRRLHEVHPNLAVGMEYFQQPFQQFLDDYISGSITEKEFLKSTEYYSRWRFDYRLYRPILSYAREHRIPIIALNISKEITSKVGKSGLESLTVEERARIPREIDRSDSDYRRRLSEVLEMHPTLNFDNFFEAQLLWDEGMAERAANYLKENPENRLILLAGSGHLAYGSGIPKRLSRRIEHDSAIVLNGIDFGVAPDVADYILIPEPVELPPQGLLGVYMSETPEGVTVNAFSEISAAKDDGMKKGDQILSLDGEPVSTSADVKLALLDKLPGDQVQIDIRRKNARDEGIELMIEVGLR